MTQETIEQGTLLTITRHAIDDAGTGLQQERPIYFRLRAYVSAGKLAPFIKTISPGDRWFQSGYSDIEYVDFRFNEVRTLPLSIAQNLRTGPVAGIRFRQIVFLTAVPVLTTVITTSTKIHKTRLLEHALWNAYVPSGIPEGMIVYHWKVEEERNSNAGVEDFTAFVKMETRKSVLLGYLLIAFAFGVLGNLAASILWEKVFPVVGTYLTSPDTSKSPTTRTNPKG